VINVIRVQPQCCDEAAAHGTALFEAVSTVNSHEKQRRVQIFEDHGWCKLAPIVFCLGLVVDLSGCISARPTSEVSGTLNSLSCSSASMSGSGKNACTLTVNTTAPSGGLSVSLSSNNAAVVLPATIEIPAGEASAGFTATVNSVASPQTVTLTASAQGVLETFTLQLNPATPAISWAAPASISYGTALSSAQLNATSTVAGTFTYSPAAGTVLQAGTQTLSVSFSPTDTTDFTNATASVPITVNPAVPAISWAAPAAIFYGAALSSTQLDATSTVAGIFTYSPAAGTVPQAGTQKLSVTLTPTDATDFTSATASVSITVNVATSMLGIGATSVGFGTVALNTPATQTLVFTSTGTGSVTVNSVVVAGTGFTVSALQYPLVIASGETANLGVQFDPTTPGAAAGSITVTSNSASGATAVIALSGTGTAASYGVELIWDPPASSVDPVVGYNIYRAPSGSITYQLLNPSVNTQTTYTDSTVQSGQSYDYIVTSVDSEGVESAPTQPVAVSIP